jgi:GAF domain-containing protein
MDEGKFSSMLIDYKSGLEKMKGDVFEYTVKFLNERIPHYNWVGIYIVEGNDLVLRTYSGPKETEHTRIKIGDGICGLAAKEQFTVVVPDVSKESKYISCFPETKSEIVVPIFKGREVIGEIDIDSDFLNPFVNEDRHFLEEIANLIGRRA